MEKARSSAAAAPLPVHAALRCGREASASVLFLVFLVFSLTTFGRRVLFAPVTLE
jgi:hypothetical protein